MQSSKASWAVVMVCVNFWSTLGCMGHTSLGEDDADSESSAGSSGSGTGGGHGGGAAGGKTSGNGGGGGEPITCPATVGFDDGRSLGLGEGPLNRALLAPRIFNEAVFNYQNNIVFEGALKAGGAFERSSGNASLGPASGAALEPFLGQVALVPPVCAGADVTGRTLKVRYLVRLTGAITEPPAHGAFLGSAHAGDFTFYGDAVADEDIINTLAARTLQHTFTEGEAADVAESGVFFNLYSLESLPIDLFIDEIVWDD